MSNFQKTTKKRMSLLSETDLEALARCALWSPVGDMNVSSLRAMPPNAQDRDASPRALTFLACFSLLPNVDYDNTSQAGRMVLVDFGILRKRRNSFTGLTGLSCIINTLDRDFESGRGQGAEIRPLDFYLTCSRHGV